MIHADQTSIPIISNPLEKPANFCINLLFFPPDSQNVIGFQTSIQGSTDIQPSWDPTILTPLQERLQPLLVLHGFADDAALLTLAARVAAAGAENLRDALRHLHSEIRFRFEEEDLPGQVLFLGALCLRSFWFGCVWFSGEVEVWSEVAVWHGVAVLVGRGQAGGVGLEFPNQSAALRHAVVPHVRHVSHQHAPRR